jgi:Piezo non-specific cation channel, R-Ras-binding domain
MHTKEAIKFSLSIQCSENNMNYMWINSNFQMIPFMVVSKVINENISYLSKFLSHGILNLKNLYMIIFIYVGLNILRRNVFN